MRFFNFFPVLFFSIVSLSFTLSESKQSHTPLLTRTDIHFGIVEFKFFLFDLFFK